MKILLRDAPERPWQKLEPFEFGGPDGEKKLERLLEKSPDLLDTGSGKPVLFFKAQVGIGSNAVDLLGVDADGTIVMVECKLEANREARRMVVGQILEYAGQLRGRSYEEFEEMLASGSGNSLVDMVRQQIADTEWSEAEFRAAVKRGLESGEFRLVVAVNGMNDELKGIVEYLSARGIRLEALKLRRFREEKSGIEILVPEMYGLPGRTAGPRRGTTWDLEGFAQDAAAKGLDSGQIDAIRGFHDRLRTELGAEIQWDHALTYASFRAKWPFSPASIIGASSNGMLFFAFGNLGRTDEEKAFRKSLRELAANKLNLPVPPDYEKKYPNFDFDWSQKTDLLVESLKAILPPDAPTVAKAS